MLRATTTMVSTTTAVNELMAPQIIVSKQMSEATTERIGTRRQLRSYSHLRYGRGKQACPVRPFVASEAGHANSGNVSTMALARG